MAGPAPVAQQQQNGSEVSPADKAAAPFRFSFLGRVAKFSEKDGVKYLSFEHAVANYGVGMPNYFKGESMLNTVTEVDLPDTLTLKSVVRVTGRAAVFTRVSQIADRNGPRGSVKDAEFPEFRFVCEKLEVVPVNGK